MTEGATATAWVVDTFACQVQGAVYVHDVAPELIEETLPLFNSMVSPWHAWLDPAIYGRHVDDVEAMGIMTALSAHGPVMSGSALHDAFDVVRGLAGNACIPAPGQEMLDELLAPALSPVGGQ